MTHMHRAPRRAAPVDVDVDELEPHELRGWLVALTLAAANAALQAATDRARSHVSPAECGRPDRTF